MSALHARGDFCATACGHLLSGRTRDVRGEAWRREGAGEEAFKCSNRRQQRGKHAPILNERQGHVKQSMALAETCDTLASPSGQSANRVPYID